MKLFNFIVALALTAPAALGQPARTPGTLGTPGTPRTLTVRGVVLTANDTPLPRVRVSPTVTVDRKSVV